MEISKAGVTILSALARTGMDVVPNYPDES